MERNGRKTYRDRHDFILSCPVKYHAQAWYSYSSFCRTLPPMLAFYPLRSISSPAAMEQANQSVGSYGASNQNALFNDPITSSINQSAPYLEQFFHASGVNGRRGKGLFW